MVVPTEDLGMKWRMLRVVSMSTSLGLGIGGGTVLGVDVVLVSLEPWIWLGMFLKGIWSAMLLGMVPSWIWRKDKDKGTVWEPITWAYGYNARDNHNKQIKRLHSAYGYLFSKTDKVTYLSLQDWSQTAKKSNSRHRNGYDATTATFMHTWVYIYVLRLSIH